MGSTGGISLLDKLAKGVAEFNSQLGTSTLATLTQVWLPEPGEDGSVLLNTQGMPFSINGCGDLLALFRCISCKYKFSTDVTKPMMLGTVGRVYTTGEPEMSQNVQRYDQSVYPRVAEAQRCNVQASLFLPIYDSSRRDTIVAVMEVVQPQQSTVFPALIDWARCCLEAAGLYTSDVDKDTLPVGLRTLVQPDYEASAFESGVGGIPGGLGMIGARAAARQSESEHALGSSRGPLQQQQRSMLPPRAPLSVGAAPLAGASFGGAQQSLAAGLGAAGGPKPTVTVHSDSVQVAPPAAIWTANTTTIKETEVDGDEAIGGAPQQQQQQKQQQQQQTVGMSPLIATINPDPAAQQALQAIMAHNQQVTAAAVAGPHVVMDGRKNTALGNDCPPSNGNALPLPWNTGVARQSKSVGDGSGANVHSRPIDLTLISEQPPAKRQALSVSAGANNNNTTVAVPLAMVPQALPRLPNGISSLNGIEGGGILPAHILQTAVQTLPSAAVSYGQGDRTLTLEDLQPHFGLSLKDAAAALGICNTTLKRACRRLGLARWPRREIKKLQAELAKRERGSGSGGSHAHSGLKDRQQAAPPPPTAAPATEGGGGGLLVMAPGIAAIANGGGGGASGGTTTGGTTLSRASVPDCSGLSGETLSGSSGDQQQQQQQLLVNGGSTAGLNRIATTVGAKTTTTTGGAAVDANVGTNVISTNGIQNPAMNNNSNNKNPLEVAVPPFNHHPMPNPLFMYNHERPNGLQGANGSAREQPFLPLAARQQGPAAASPAVIPTNPQQQQQQQQNQAVHPADTGLGVSSYDGSGGMESLDILAGAEYEMSVGNAPPGPEFYQIEGNFGLEFGGN